MKSHLELSDSELEELFANCQLDPSIFSHEAHLRLAYIHISRYGLHAAESNIQDQLKKYVAFVGATDKYNATLTVAAIKTVYHFMLKSNALDFTGFINEHPRLKNEFCELMTLHYRDDIFTSEKAKVTFLKPDLIPFD